MANTLRFKRGLVSTIPTALAGEPLFTTDTFDLYIGNGTGNTRFQKYIASGTTSQLIRGDGSLLTMPIVLTSPSSGQVLKYDGTNWVNSSDAGVTGSGVAGQVTYWNGTGTITGNTGLVFNGTNRLTIDGGTTGYLVGPTGEMLIGEDAGGVYIGYGFGVSPAIPINYGSTGTTSHIWRANGSERMRLHSTGNLVLGGTVSTDNGLRFQVTGDGYFSSKVSIGTTSTNYTLSVSQNNLPTLGFIDPTEATDQKQWAFQSGITVGAGVFRLRALNDAFTNGQNAFIITKSGIAIQTHQWFTANTERMRLDASGNLGLGVTPSAWSSTFKALQIGLGTSLYNNAGGNGTFLGSNFFFNGTNNIYLNSTTASAYGQTGGQHQWFTAPSGIAGNAISFTQAMTLDASGRLGIGTTNPIYRLDVFGDARFGDGNNFNPLIQFAGSGRAAGSPGYSFVGDLDTGMYNPNLGNTIAFSTAGVERARIDSSGNLGLGVTPSAWAAGTRAIDFGSGSALWNPGSTTNTYLATNAYYDITDNRWEYKGTGGAGNYHQFGSEHRWNQAAAGTANQPITFTQAMTLDASGRLGIGLTAPTERLVVRSIGNSYANSAALSIENNTGANKTYITNANGVLYITNNTASDHLALYTTGNLSLSGTSDTGERLQVNGTMRVSGVATFATTLNTARIQLASNTTYSGILDYSAVTGLWYFNNQTAAASSATDYFQFQADGAAILTLKKSGAATFSSSGQFGGNLVVSKSSDSTVNVNSTTDTSYSAFFHSESGTPKAYWEYINSNYTEAARRNYLEAYNIVGGFAIYTANVKRLDIGTTGAATFSSSVTASGNGTTNSAFIANNQSASGAQHYIDFTAGATTIGRILRGNGAAGLPGNGINIDSYEGFQIRINQLGGSVGTFNFTGGAATFSSSVTATRYLVTPSGSSLVYNFVNSDNTYTGAYVFQAGGGSASFGGGIVAYGHSHATKAGWITAGISSGSGGKFSVNNHGIGSGSDVFTVDANGAGVFFSTAQAAGFITSGGAGYAVINSASNTVTALRPTGGGASIMSTNSNGLHIAVGTQAAGDLILASNNTERIRLSSNGFFSQLNATNPSASITDSYIQYSADVVAGNAAPHFRTENGAVIKLYQETTAVGNAIFSQGGGNAVLDDSTFAGYTIRQVVQALRNQGILQ